MHLLFRMRSADAADIQADFNFRILKCNDAQGADNICLKLQRQLVLPAAQGILQNSLRFRMLAVNRQIQIGRLIQLA